MLPIEIRPDIYWVGVNDRTTELFEGLWPIKQEGISYNSYLINDEKKALIDMSSELTTHEFIEQIQDVMNFAELDYVIINHMEPDHSGALTALRLIAPQVTIIGSQKTSEMLERFYGITENVRVVADGETLSLGKHTLRFFSTPFIHWPETMMTYETSEQILFSCDAFGGFGSLDGSIFDDRTDRQDWYEEQALRYYVNIVSTFSKPVRNAITKLSAVPIQIVAPSHGLIWRGQPGRIIQLYQKWAGYASGPADLGVTLLYASMYGNTEKMMEVIAQGVADQGVPVSIFPIQHISVSTILPSLWTRHGVLIGAPTYEGGLFPIMVHTLQMADTKRMPGRLVGRFGSHAWNGGGQKAFEQLAEKLKWDLYGNFEFSGAPNKQELIRGRAFGAAFAENLRQVVNELRAQSNLNQNRAPAPIAFTNIQIMPVDEYISRAFFIHFAR